MSRRRKSQNRSKLPFWKQDGRSGVTIDPAVKARRDRINKLRKLLPQYPTNSVIRRVTQAEINRLENEEK